MRRLAQRCVARDRRLARIILHARLRLWSSAPTKFQRLVAPSSTLAVRKVACVNLRLHDRHRRGQRSTRWWRGSRSAPPCSWDRRTPHLAPGPAVSVAAEVSQHQRFCDLLPGRACRARVVGRIHLGAAAAPPLRLSSESHGTAPTGAQFRNPRPEAEAIDSVQAGGGPLRDRRYTPRVASLSDLDEEALCPSPASRSS